MLVPSEPGSARERRATWAEVERSSHGGVYPAGRPGPGGTGGAGNVLLSPGYLLLRQGQGQCGEGTRGQQELGGQLALAAGGLGPPGRGREGLSQPHLPGAETRYLRPAPSFFSRKDSIRTIYTSLQNELKKVVTGRGALGGTAPHVEELLSHLSEQLCFFVQARMEIADFYEKMYTLSTQKFINAEELIGLLDTILKKYSSRFHHPILSPLESSFQLEVDVLSHLLKAQAQVSEWKFLSSLVNLHSAHTKLQTWGQIFEKQRETKKHLFGGQSQKAVQPPHLFLWLMKLKNMLLAKFSFYFHEALSRQTSASEMKTLTAKANPDLFGKISSFIRKYDAANVSLIFDNRGSESFQGHGYHHPHSYREAPKGVDQYPAVVSLPSDRPVMHWPNVIMIMTDRTSDLNSLDKVVHFYDDKVQSTYFLTRPEPHFTIVVIFESKKSERDSHFISFLNELSLALKNPKVFASLKPGSKG
ncbi:KICSTOR subunit 2 isoform 3-T3 [Trichechus inunguis]